MSERVATPRLTITPEEATAHALPAARIEIDTGSVVLAGPKFPDDTTYVALSGPPGGPLGLRVLHVESPPEDDAAWRLLVENLFEGRPLTVGQAGEVEIDGSARRTYSCTTGQSLARSHHVLVLFDAPAPSGAVLVDFFSTAGSQETPAPADIVEGAYARTVQSLRVTFP